MRFQFPAVLLAAAIVPWFWWYACRHTGVSRQRLAWRTVAAALLVVAAAGGAVRLGTAPVTVMAVVDRSASVPLAAQRQALARLHTFADTMRAGDRLGVVLFGADAAVAHRPSTGAPAGLQATVRSTGTNIAAALRLARTVVPTDAGSRIVLMSDGHETAGRAELEALQAAAAGIAVDVVATSTPIGSALSITRVSAPSTVAAGEPFLVAVGIAGAPAGRGEIVLYQDGEIRARRTVQVGRDGAAAVAFDVTESQPRTLVFRAGVETPDGGDASHAPGAAVIVTGPPSVLYVSSTRSTLTAPLQGAGFRVQRVTPAQVPTSTRGLLAFTGVILDDVAADDLLPAAVDALASYVEDEGGGLLVLGGARTLTLDGYPSSTLERVLPIDLRPRGGQRGASADLVLLFDKSGSMADLAEGVPKIEVARQAVMRAMEVLPASDRLGVIAFAASPQVVSALAAGQDGTAMRRALQAVTPGGATAIAPAFETALGWLRASGPGVTRRQILLISDGRTSEGDAARLRALARSGGVAVSVVAVGDGADRPLLEELASVSGGRAYFPEGLRNLPREVAREAARASGGGIVEERFAVRAAAHPVLAGIDRTALPQLDGYVVGAAKPTAGVVLASHLDDPVLAAWQPGLGRVAMFTADLGSAWSVDMRAWGDAGRMWAQTLRWIGRRETDSALQPSIEEHSDGVRLVLQMESEGDLPDLDDLRLDVHTPDGRHVVVTPEPTAPGRYEAPLLAPVEGLYAVATTGRERDSLAEHRSVRALYWSADREAERRGADGVTLSRLATLGGGRQLAEADSPFDGPRQPGYRDVSAWAAAAALLIFVVDIGGVIGARGAGRRRRDLNADAAVQKRVAA